MCENWIAYSCRVIPCYKRATVSYVQLSRSQFGHLCRRGVIFKNLGIGSLMLALKPAIGFENSRPLVGINQHPRNKCFVRCECSIRCDIYNA